MTSIEIETICTIHIKLGLEYHSKKNMSSNSVNKGVDYHKQFV